MRKNILSLLFIALLTSNVYAADLEGEIKDPAVTEQPEFIITLTPPKASPVPKEITSSSPNGQYSFEKINNGKYLFEILYGDEVIYREVIEVKGDGKKDVTLTRE
jgi:hypothetical protein